MNKLLTLLRGNVISDGYKRAYHTVPRQHKFRINFTMKKSVSAGAAQFPATSTVAVYDAGGGPGRSNIEFETLFEGQCSMYARTLNKLSDFQAAHLAQEKRQITLVDEPITIYINLAREDFPDITTRLKVVYIKSATSQAWAQLLKDACIQLKIDFIHSILDRADKSPVSRILRLRPGGDYLARQRETSAILEVINTGRTPVQVSWEITMDINDVKKELAFDQRNMPIIDRRIASLVAKPVTRETQREITTLILNAVSPKAAVGIIEQFHKQFVGVNPFTESELPIIPEGGTAPAVPIVPSFGDVAKYHEVVDIVSLHRLCLETLGRFVAQGKAKMVATGPCFDYVCKVIDELRSEVDVVTLGLKLLSDVMKYLVEAREEVFHVVLNCVQAYAPPASKHRPRNPKRLRPPEDQYMDLETSNTGRGGAGGGDVYGGSDQQGGGGGMGHLDIREAGSSNPNNPNSVLHSGMHPSLKRYGDFYGHSVPCAPDAATSISEPIKVTSMDTLDVLHRLIVPEVVTPKPVVADNVEPIVVKAAPVVEAAPIEVKALVRGRVRIDHSAATHAMQDAFHQPTGAGAGAGVAKGVSPSEDGEVSAEFIQQQKEFKERQKNKPPKFKFKMKSKGNTSDGGGASSGGESEGDGEDIKKEWKGTVGSIGRRAPEKVKEVKIDFKKKVAYDHTKDDQDHQEGTDTGEAKKEGAEDEVDSNAIASALKASTAARRKKRKHKFALVPLPLVACVVFRGLSGKMKQNMAMTQSFATLFKMIAQNYGNRDVAFKMGVAEEISVIATVCQAMPRVLDYYIWIIDALYRDGFGEINADELDIALEDYTMVLSAGLENQSVGTAASHTDEKSMNGFIFETISEMSVPSIDMDGLLSEVTPVVNMGELIPYDGNDLHGGASRRGTSRRTIKTSATPAAGEGSQLGTDDARDEDGRDLTNQIKKAANQLLVNVLGQFEFEARYVNRPADNIVLGVAMVSAHAELDPREKQMACRWLDVWDDCSRDYKMIKKKGMDLSGL